MTTKENIDNKRKINNRMAALVLTPPASRKTYFQVCDVRMSSLAELTSNGIVMDSFSGSAMHLPQDHRGLLFGITVEGRF